MKLRYFFGCMLAAASLAVWPGTGLAHGGGGDRGGGRFLGGGGRFAGTHFTARSDDRLHRQFHHGNGGVVIFDPPDFGSYYDLPTDDTVYQGQIAPQDAENLPYATPTSDPDIVISPYVPHAAISVAGIPHEATVRDPVSNLVFLNP
jgi:hypothetical protein